MRESRKTIAREKGGMGKRKEGGGVVFGKKYVFFLM